MCVGKIDKVTFCVAKQLKFQIQCCECSNNAVVDVTVVVMFEPCWMDPIIDFLAQDRVSNDEEEANPVRRVYARYWLSADRKLY